MLKVLVILNEQIYFVTFIHMTTKMLYKPRGCHSLTAITVEAIGQKTKAVVSAMRTGLPKRKLQH